ncbi:hypothetical protein [Cedecea sp. NFIX57]|jgi:flagellar motor switch protein FliG|uniref:hypothetical protein n=1 Tax=Cedecea sp. NFIX57 TaxID=1566286 RepID=UPI000A0AA6FC|nr:hypothetical protein [Cedecea sp. NFIX57]SMG61623.1 hypothetical protein SAMN03159353_105012 [Cedecea sp. NFIX57]
MHLKLPERYTEALLSEQKDHRTTELHQEIREWMFLLKQLDTSQHTVSQVLRGCKNELQQVRLTKIHKTV